MQKIKNEKENIKMKDFLKKLLAARQNTLAELKERNEKATDVAELRSITSETEKVKAEIRDIEGQIADLDEAEARKATPAGVVNPVFVGGTTDKTLDERKAFMDYVQRGVTSDLLKRAEVSTTADSGILIPETIVKEIIKELDTYGNIYKKVRKLNIKGGIKFPVGITKPQASWIVEGAVSDTLKISTSEYVEFGYKILECRVAQTLLASVVSLDVFEKEFIALTVEAMTYALEYAIFNGDGNTMPLGILNDTRIKKANIIEVTADELKDYEAVRNKIFGGMKKAYKNKGEFIMAESSYEYLLSATDTNGQPIARVTVGLEGKENSYRYFGKHVETVEDDLITPIQTATAGTVVALYMNLNDYAINSNMSMQTVQYFDHDTNTKKTKSILIADGKLVDVNGVYVIKLAE